MRPGAAVLIFALFCACEAEVEAPYMAQCDQGPPLPFPGAVGAQVLVNAYYLQEEAARDVRAGRTESPALEEVLAKSAALGVSVVRAHAFNDGESKIGDSAIQLAPGEYDEVSFQGLDRVLHRAHAHGLKLILPLGNHWDDYGGARRYVGWAGLADPVEGDSRFYTEPEPRLLYKLHLEEVLTRVNSVDGIRYADHPAVLAWELLNEPRLSANVDPEGMLLAEWVDEVAEHVKRLSPHRLLGTGEEGFEPDAEHGGSYHRNTRSSFIDFGGAHLYPEKWGVAAESLAEAGVAWIASRARLARELGKPFVLGEFGLSNEGPLALEERREVYRQWFRCAQRAGAAAFGPWLFAYDARPEQWDPFSFYYRDGTLPWDAPNRYADLLIEAARDKRPVLGF